MGTTTSYPRRYASEMEQIEHDRFFSFVLMLAFYCLILAGILECLFYVLKPLLSRWQKWVAVSPWKGGAIGIFLEICAIYSLMVGLALMPVCFPIGTVFLIWCALFAVMNAYTWIEIVYGNTLSVDEKHRLSIAWGIGAHIVIIMLMCLLFSLLIIGAILTVESEGLNSVIE